MIKLCCCYIKCPDAHLLPISTSQHPNDIGSIYIIYKGTHEYHIIQFPHFPRSGKATHHPQECHDANRLRWESPVSSGRPVMGAEMIDTKSHPKSSYWNAKTQPILRGFVWYPSFQLYPNELENLFQFVTISWLASSFPPWPRVSSKGITSKWLSKHESSFNYKVDGKREEGYIHRVLQRGFRWCFSKTWYLDPCAWSTGSTGTTAEHNDVYWEYIL